MTSPAPRNSDTGQVWVHPGHDTRAPTAGTADRVAKELWYLIVSWVPSVKDQIALSQVNRDTHEGTYLHLAESLPPPYRTISFNPSISWQTFTQDYSWLYEAYRGHWSSLPDLTSSLSGSITQLGQQLVMLARNPLFSDRVRAYSKTRWGSCRHVRACTGITSLICVLVHPLLCWKISCGAACLGCTAWDVHAENLEKATIRRLSALRIP